MIHSKKGPRTMNSEQRIDELGKIINMIENGSFKEERKAILIEHIMRLYAPEVISKLK